MNPDAGQNVGEDFEQVARIPLAVQEGLPAVKVDVDLAQPVRFTVLPNP